MLYTIKCKQKIIVFKTMATMTTLLLSISYTSLPNILTFSIPSPSPTLLFLLWITTHYYIYKMGLPSYAVCPTWLHCPIYSCGYYMVAYASTSVFRVFQYPYPIHVLSYFVPHISEQACLVCGHYYVILKCPYWLCTQY